MPLPRTTKRRKKEKVKEKKAPPAGQAVPKRKLKKPDSFKYVLVVGDEGGILVLYNAGKLEKRLFISSPSAQELGKSLGEHPKAPIYVLVDVLDQAFVQHALPPVSPFAIGNLVKKRLAKDFGDQDLKAARKLYREKKGRKDWHYLFVSVNYAPPLSDWVDAIINLPNPFAGIYLLPIETEPYLKKLEAQNPKKPTKPVRWHILVSHNRVGGFRQIVYRDHKVIFTRIAQPIGGLAPDVIAGNIEQETLNTVEYIRRLGFDNAEELDIYIICSQEVKAAIDQGKLHGRTTTILTPFETAAALNIPSAAEKTDRFGDVVLASFFINHRRPVLKFTTPYSKKLEMMNLSIKLAAGLGAVLVPWLLVESGMSIADIMEAKDKVEQELQSKAAAEKELREIEEIQKALPDFSARAVDVVAVNLAVTKETSMPLSFMNDFAKLRTGQVEVKKVTLTVEENLTTSNRITATYSALISNPTGSIDRLLEDIDRFTESIRARFRTYDVSFSGLPGEKTGSYNLQLSNAQATPSTPQAEQKSPFEITIKGPIGETARTNAPAPDRRR